jgi:hypothetical protein
MPPALHAALVALVNASLQVVVAFGVSVSDAQNVAITAVTNSLLVVLSVLAANRRPPSPKPSP